MPQYWWWYMFWSRNFNTFYTTVALKLVKKLPASVNKFGKYFVRKFYANLGVILNNYCFSLVFENHVLKYLTQLGANKATS